jgi:hypothetical protein
MGFYRYGPWTFPIGLNPNFGLDISSSIIYSNSMPLLAMLFKPFSGLLGEPFQFLGLWILLCFILQAWITWLLSVLITKDIWVNRYLQAQAILTKRFGNQIALPIPLTVLNNEKFKIDFSFPMAVSPKVLGIGIDVRPLGIGLEAL